MFDAGPVHGGACAGGCAELRREVERLRAIERAAIEFCERCRAGEIRSERTYRLFQSALAPSTSQATGASGR